MLTHDHWYWLILAGAAGALVRVLVDSGCLLLPKVVDGKLVLGFIGSMVVGGFVGYVVDGSIVGAGMGGFIGADMLDRFTNAFEAKYSNIVSLNKELK